MSNKISTIWQDVKSPLFECRRIPRCRLFRALLFIVYFYGGLMILVGFLSRYLNVNLIIAIWIILGANYVIALFTQISPYKLIKKEALSDHLYKHPKDCFIRCLAGVFEMIFYTISFATNFLILIAGYLLLKALSAWKPDKEKAGASDEDSELLGYSASVKEGLSTANLRIAVIFSLICSLVASYFLFQFLKAFDVFDLSAHLFFR